MKLIIKPAAAKAILRMPKRDALALRERLEVFAADPHAPHGWAKPLVGTRAVRLRQGDWRAICRIDSAAGVVSVEEVGNRKEIYQ